MKIDQRIQGMIPQSQMQPLQQHPASQSFVPNGMIKGLKNHNINLIIHKDTIHLNNNFDIFLKNILKSVC